MDPIVWNRTCKWDRGTIEDNLLMERHRAAADRMARHVPLTLLSAAKAKSTSTTVTIRALPRFSALCTVSRFALGMKSSTRPLPASLQHVSQYNEAHEIRCRAGGQMKQLLRGQISFLHLPYSLHYCLMSDGPQAVLEHLLHVPNFLFGHWPLYIGRGRCVECTCLGPSGSATRRSPRRPPRHAQSTVARTGACRAAQSAYVGPAGHRLLPTRPQRPPPLPGPSSPSACHRSIISL